MYRIEIVRGAQDELDAIKRFERNVILDDIEDRLEHEPAKPSRRRKQIDNLTPSFEAVPPLWQLTVGEWRVFYDVEELSKIVWVRAVRNKPPEKRTEDIL